MMPKEPENPDFSAKEVMFTQDGQVNLINLKKLVRDMPKSKVFFTDIQAKIDCLQDPTNLMDRFEAPMFRAFHKETLRISSLVADKKLTQRDEVLIHENFMIMRQKKCSQCGLLGHSKAFCWMH